MELDKLFWLAFQSSFFLGLVHGVNPCGHSWLVLAPFVVGTREGKKVAWLTTTFLVGTALACLLLGLTIGTLSGWIPAHFSRWVDIVVSSVLVLLGSVLLVKPHLLHHHGHSHGHDHDDHHHGPPGKGDHHGEGHACCAPAAGCSLTSSDRKRAMTGTALFTIGFANMIIPCPTVAIMYSYALDSASSLKASLVFGIYAIGTALAVGGVIFAIHKVTTLLKKLCQDWVETAILRTAGVLTVLFGLYAMWQQLGG